MKRILIIEDDITLNKTLSLNLQKNYLLESAYDIKSAFLKINRSNFDLLILDVGLPDGDGFSFCRSLKQRCNSNAAIIFLTANDVEMDIINLRDVSIICNLLCIDKLPIYHLIHF